jgi:hypothetical protein
VCGGVQVQGFHMCSTCVHDFRSTVVRQLQLHDTKQCGWCGCVQHSSVGRCGYSAVLSDDHQCSPSVTVFNNNALHKDRSISCHRLTDFDQE